MSISMDGEAEDADYSSFQYQFVNASNEINAAGNESGNLGQEFVLQFDPLEDIGGLSNNEVAELVYLEVQPSLEPEDEVADQNVSTAAEHRGVVGANITEEGGLSGLGTNNELGNDVGYLESSRDEIFQLFEARGVLPFDDQNTGPGGGSVQAGPVYTKNWRQLTGRGPVLDQSDSMAISGFTVAGDTTIAVVGNTRIHMVWDVAEVSDAGRAFSVPMDD